MISHVTYQCTSISQPSTDITGKAQINYKTWRKTGAVLQQADAFKRVSTPQQTATTRITAPPWELLTTKTSDVTLENVTSL